MAGLFEGFYRGVSGLINADRADDRAKEAREGREAALQRMDFDYNQTADLAPEYKRAESPVARAYLESFLMGNNPDAVQGTRLGSGAARANASQAFDRMYGGMDNLQRAGAAERGDNRHVVLSAMNRDRAEHEANRLESPGAAQRLDGLTQNAENRRNRLRGG